MWPSTVAEPSAHAPRWQVEECTPEELVDLDAALTAAEQQHAQGSSQARCGSAPAEPARAKDSWANAGPSHAQRAPLAPPPPPPRVVGTAYCEALSVSEFAVRVPRAARDALAAALHALPATWHEAPDGTQEARLPLVVYPRAEEALTRARLLPPRPARTCFGGPARLPRPTYFCLRDAADRATPGTREYRLQAALNEEAEELFARIPPALRDSLLPFQVEGVKQALRNGGVLLLADEMGVGKTRQGIAFAAAYAHEGPILLVVPKPLRLQWAEELERLLPGLRPHECAVVGSTGTAAALDDMPRTAQALLRAADIELQQARAAGASPERVAELQDRASLPAAEAKAARKLAEWRARGTRIVITSFYMHARQRSKFADVAWGTLIVDESHNMRTSSSAEQSAQTAALALLATQIRRRLFMTGTPTLSRPFDLYHQVHALQPLLLGRDKCAFGQAYCGARTLPNGTHSYSGGSRLTELHVLLTHTGLMLRRMKSDVAADLPPKRRQVVRLCIDDAKDAAMALAAGQADVAAAARGKAGSAADDAFGLSDTQRNALRKVPVMWDWMLEKLLRPDCAGKTVIFAHHISVLNLLQGRVEAHAKDIGGGAASSRAPYVRIDGSMDAPARAAAVQRFQSDPHARLALLSITATSSGLDFSAAAAVVFAELPREAADLQQAEARVHRRGVRGSVDVYFLCTPDDDAQWVKLSRAMLNVNVTHGARGEAAEVGLEVDAVVDAQPPAAAPAADAAMPPPAAAAAEAADEPPQPLRADEAAADDVAPPPAEADEAAAIVSAPAATAAEPAADAKEDATELFFEVSANTSRLHVYRRLTGGGSDDDDPMSFQHLCNVLPAELAAAARSSPAERPSVAALAALPRVLARSPAVRRAARTFLRAWQNLTPLQRSLLFATRSRTPLCVPLHGAVAAAEAARAPSAPSMHRTAKRAVLAAPPPPKSELCFVTMRTAGVTAPVGPNDTRSKQYRSAQRVWLCIACNAAPARLQHPPGAAPVVSCLLDMCCTLECHQRYTFATDASALRKALFELERGVCRVCRQDCAALAARVNAVKDGAVARSIILATEPRFGEPEHAKMLDAVVNGDKKHLWEADHITPVAEGGGLCGLENMRTLCLLCHCSASAAFAARNAQRKRAAKHQRAAAAEGAGALSYQSVKPRLGSPAAEESEWSDDPAFESKNDHEERKARYAAAMAAAGKEQTKKSKAAGLQAPPPPTKKVKQER